MKNFFRIILFLMLTSSLLPAQEAGKSGFAFLKIGVDARAAGMGDAYTAIARDAAITYWNPAGLALTHTNSVVLTHNSWLQDINHEFLAIQMFSGRHNIALSVNMIFVPGIELRDDRATDIPYGETSAHNLALAGSYATTVFDEWQVGAQVKYLYEKYYLESADGVAFDLGMINDRLIENLTWGLVVQNIGSMARLRNESTALPLTVRTGIGYRLPWTLLESKPLVAADLAYNKSGDMRLNLGLEYDLKSFLTLRTGYIFGSETMNFTAGVGFNYESFTISYAFVPFMYDLGNSHRFSLAWML
jgi:hypothetical protein